MARPNRRLTDALAATIDRLNRGDRYSWTHMGSCNCGHLAQTVTGFQAADIHAMALEKEGDWSQQALAWCPASGYAIDHVIGALLELGLEDHDLIHLERLSDRAVLRRLPLPLRDLHYKDRDDVVLYLQTWRAMLQEALERLQVDRPMVAKAVRWTSG